MTTTEDPDDDEPEPERGAPRWVVVVLGALGVTTIALAYPSLTNNWELWKPIGTVSLYVLLFVGLFRRINRTSRERGEALLKK